MGAIKVCVLTSVHSCFDVRIFHKECRSLARAGFDVTLLAPHDRDETVDNVHIRPLPVIHQRLRRMTVGALAALRQAERVNAAVYHLHDPELIPVGMVLRARGKRVVYDIHEDLPAAILSKAYLPRWSRRVISPLAGLLGRLASRSFTALIPATPAIAAQFANGGAPATIVQNFPSLDEFFPVADRPWSERRNTVAYVGGITEIRGIAEMVDAMALLPPEVSATLELAGAFGSPDLRERMAARPGWRRVVHSGFLDRAHVVALLGRVRAGLVLFHPEPNHEQSYPTKMFEYMSAGIPVIASDFPLWRSIVDEVGCGLLVNPLDPAAIARAVEYVLTRDSETEAMGRAGREAVKLRFNWAHEERKLVSVYRRITST